jgi:hypothetical protein
MKNVLSSAIVAATLLGMAAPLAAQAPGIDFKLNPRIGLYEPLSDLGDAPDAASTAASELAGSLALGLGLEIGVAALPVGLRLNMDYATGSEVEYDDGFETESGYETTVLALAADLMFRPIPRLIIAQPYFFAGGGLKQYDFEPTGSDPVASFEDESDFTVHVGGGLDVGFGPLSLNAEVGDYISWWESQDPLDLDADSEIQHDLFLTVGLAIGLL